jgi:hypothetical protein
LRMRQCTGDAARVHANGNMHDGISAMQTCMHCVLSGDAAGWKAFPCAWHRTTKGILLASLNTAASSHEAAKYRAERSGDRADDPARVAAVRWHLST